MGKSNRYCPQCGAEAHPTQTLCTKCQAEIPLERPGRGKCFACGKPLPASIIRPGANLVSVGGGLYQMGVSANHSCPSCGDPNPTTPSHFSGYGSLLVGLQALAWSVVLPAYLYSLKGPYHLSGGKAFLAAFAILIGLLVWSSWARRFTPLAVPLFVLLTFWPFVVEGPDEIRMKFFLPTLLVNLVAFPMLVKTRRKPFKGW